MNKSKCGVLVVFMLGVLLLPAVLFAAVPGQISFQGRLLDKNKNPKSGLFSITFGIWDTGPGTGGSEIWNETQDNVQVTNGMFTVQLGSVSAIGSTVFDSPTRWLQIQVGTEILAPREQLATSPYSFRAAKADNVSAGVITNTQVNGTAGIAWTKIDKTGASLVELSTRSAGDLNQGTLLAARGGTGISGAGGTGNRILLTTNGSNWIAEKLAPNTMVSAGAFPNDVIISSVAFNAVGSGQIVNNTVMNDDINSSAGIAWTKIDKTGSSLADLATKTLPQLSDVADFAAAQGDILIRTGADWDRLPAGTDRYFLQTRGAGVNPVWAPVMGTLIVWNCDAAAGVALQGLNLPAIQTELDATIQGTRIFVTGEDIGSQVQMHLNARVAASGVGLTITVIVAESGTPANILGTLNFSGAAVASFQLKTAWASKPAWLTGDRKLAVYTSGGDGTADFIFRDISIRWK